MWYEECGGEKTGDEEVLKATKTKISVDKVPKKQNAETAAVMNKVMPTENLKSQDSKVEGYCKA